MKSTTNESIACTAREGLNLRRKKSKPHKSAQNREKRHEVAKPNERWSMDFMSDALFNDRRFRVLTLIDT